MPITPHMGRAWGLDPLKDLRTHEDPQDLRTPKWPNMAQNGPFWRSSKCPKSALFRPF